MASFFIIAILQDMHNTARHNKESCDTLYNETALLRQHNSLGSKKGAAGSPKRVYSL